MALWRLLVLAEPEGVEEKGRPEHAQEQVNRVGAHDCFCLRVRYKLYAMKRTPRARPGQRSWNIPATMHPALIFSNQSAMRLMTMLRR